MTGCLEGKNNFPSISFSRAVDDEDESAEREKGKLSTASSFTILFSRIDRWLTCLIAPLHSDETKVNNTPCHHSYKRGDFRHFLSFLSFFST